LGRNHYFLLFISYLFITFTLTSTPLEASGNLANFYLGKGKQTIANVSKEETSQYFTLLNACCTKKQGAMGRHGP
jgi:hypothetical protein